MENLRNLRAKAKRVLDALRSREQKEPIFIEFSGSPKSGKSTCIDTVAHFLRRMGYKVLAPTEGASKRTPYYLKDDITAFNTWSACYALTHVLEGLYEADRYHIAILDRGLFDALVWFELLATDGVISRRDCKRVHNFLLIKKWRAAISAVFLFKTDPRTSMKRENRHKLTSDPGRAMNPPFLRALNKAYERIRRKYSREFPYFVVIDTSHGKRTTPRSTAARVVRQILDLLAKQQ